MNLAVKDPGDLDEAMSPHSFTSLNEIDHGVSKVWYVTLRSTMDFEDLVVDAVFAEESGRETRIFGRDADAGPPLKLKIEKRRALWTDQANGALVPVETLKPQHLAAGLPDPLLRSYPDVYLAGGHEIGDVAQPQEPKAYLSTRKLLTVDVILARQPAGAEQIDTSAEETSLRQRQLKRTAGHPRMA